MPLFALLNSVSENPPNEVVYAYKSLPKGENRVVIKNEYNVLQSKFKKLRLKVEERMPIYSQLDGFKWFIIKNRFGVYTMVYIDSKRFEEDFVFSLRKKIEMILENKREIILTNNPDLEVIQSKLNLFL